jgi:PAS domain S-box-containing protein
MMDARRSRSRFFKRSVVVFAPLALAALTVMYALFHIQSDAARSIARVGEAKVVEIARQRISSRMQVVFADIRYLTEAQSLRRLLLSGDTVAAKQELAEDFAAFVGHKKIYDQIRYIDVNGQEIVRVDLESTGPVIVPDAELQNKMSRYYVQEGLNLSQDQVHVSSFDLNVENDAIEQPIKPMIRLSAPVFDSDGQLKGIVVLNYLGANLLDLVDVLGDQSTEQIWLLNANGYWLLGPSREDEWTFMYPDRQNHSFASVHPEAWNAMRAAELSGQFMAGGDLFSFRKVGTTDRTPSSESEETVVSSAAAAGDWYLVTRVSGAILAEQRNRLAWTFALPTIALLALLFLVALVIARFDTHRRRAEDRLRMSEARARGLLESAPDAVIIADSNGRILQVNAGTEDLFGHSRDRLVGQPVELLIPERFRANHIGYRNSYMRAPRTRSMGAGADLFGLHADGTEIPVDISLGSVQIDSSNHVVVSIRDASERHARVQEIKDLNDRLSRDNNELSAINKELEAFSYSVAHDLRAPLRAIDGFSQAVMEDYADRLDDQGRNYLNRIRDAAKRQGMLIDDLLNLSRITRMDVNIVDVNLAALASEIVETLRRAAPERPVEVQIAEGLSVRGDPRLLRIALDNLLGNAWKFTAGRSPARIEIGRIVEDGEPVFYVRDNGVGFDMAYADQLFRPFHRLHDAREFPGTGIGLATVQRVVHKHGGRIWAKSEPDKGATFYFTI